MNEIMPVFLQFNHEWFQLIISMRNIKNSYILAVDDNADNLLALETTLTGFNQSLITAHSAKQALKYILQYEFAVILMDAHMPGIDGFEAARIIRSRPKNASTPIIFMTALYKDETDVAEGYALGAVDYIFKPINPHILLSKVKIFVELYEKNEQTHVLQNELKKRLAAERELKLLTKQTQQILNSAGEGILGINSRGIINFSNPAAAAILACDIQELIGQPFHLFMPELKHAWQASAFYQTLKSNCSYHKESDFFVKKDGLIIPVEYTVTPLIDSRPSRQGLVVLFKDISERLRTQIITRQQQHQIQLAKRSRMSTMAEVASSLAHELNQPLSAIANYTKGSIRRLETDNPNIPEILNAMKKAGEQSERAGEIIHRIKSVIQKGKLYRKKENINNVIRSAVSLMEFEMQTISFQLNYSLLEPMPLILLDNIQIEQVLANLLRNSIEAMAEAKTENPIIQINSEIINNKVEVSVIDNGPGVPLHIMKYLLDAYFSTKPNGMGIGLAVCRTIIEAHGGYIQIKPAANEGAWLQFSLPI